MDAFLRHKKEVSSFSSEVKKMSAFKKNEEIENGSIPAVPEYSRWLRETTIRKSILELVNEINCQAVFHQVVFVVGERKLIRET